ncbi:hypothetical protein PCL_07962 [Purpureocillium lilacinum]|uniref:Uncharacterized protein n=1 Tax=Purpureocillium lilacinum TaxID=33203 RepID=A0A2U3EJF7_PURLI|nr:hypothetical protein PCL_07962 [Purpureocillium lilacinum]
MLSATGCPPAVGWPSALAPAQAMCRKAPPRCPGTHLPHLDSHPGSLLQGIVWHGQVLAVGVGSVLSWHPRSAGRAPTAGAGRHAQVDRRLTCRTSNNTGKAARTRERALTAAEQPSSEHNLHQWHGRVGTLTVSHPPGCNGPPYCTTRLSSSLGAPHRAAPHLLEPKVLTKVPSFSRERARSPTCAADEEERTAYLVRTWNATPHHPARATSTIIMVFARHTLPQARPVLGSSTVVCKSRQLGERGSHTLSFESEQGTPLSSQQASRLHELDLLGRYEALRTNNHAGHAECGNPVTAWWRQTTTAILH